MSQERPCAGPAVGSSNACRGRAWRGAENTVHSDSSLGAVMWGVGDASARPQCSTRCTEVLQAPGWGTQQMELCGAWPGTTCHVWGGHSRLCFAYEPLVFFGTALNVFVPHCQESLKGRRALITPTQQLGCPVWAFGGPLGGPPEPGRGPKGRGAWAGTQVAVSHGLLSVQSSHGLQMWLGDVL